MIRAAREAHPARYQRGLGVSLFSKPSLVPSAPSSSSGRRGRGGGRWPASRRRRLHRDSNIVNAAFAGESAAARAVAHAAAA